MIASNVRPSVVLDFSARLLRAARLDPPELSVELELGVDRTSSDLRQSVSRTSQVERRRGGERGERDEVVLAEMYDHLDDSLRKPSGVLADDWERRPRRSVYNGDEGRDHVPQLVVRLGDVTRRPLVEVLERSRLGEAEHRIRRCSLEDNQW